jgi:NAD(P)-dependent dehydrogenase (short-subunit alcohol dehydrogenase family)
MKRMLGKTALVTGSTRGLGLEIARAYANEGARVIILSRKAEACDAVATELRGATGADILAMPCHVGHWEEVSTLVDALRSREIAVDVLVNNAGIAPTYDRLEDVTQELFDKTISVNARGPFRLGALMGSYMAELGGGSIINISSVASIRPRPESLPYAMAKAALNALTVGLAYAYAPTVRVNGIICGPFVTDIMKDWSDETRSLRTTTMALSRFGRPDEVNGAAIYLASDESSFTTGTMLRVDGGIP